MSYALDYLHHSLWGIPPMMIILAQVGTLRGLQDTVTPLKVATVGTLINIVLNWLLIYPVGWGVAGSATGTSLTQWGMAAALGVVMMRAPANTPSAGHPTSPACVRCSHSAPGSCCAPCLCASPPC